MSPHFGYSADSNDKQHTISVNFDGGFGVTKNMWMDIHRRYKRLFVDRDPQLFGVPTTETVLKQGLPVEGGKATAAAIPGAELLIVEGTRYRGRSLVPVGGGHIKSYCQGGESVVPSG